MQYDHRKLNRAREAIHQCQVTKHIFLAWCRLQQMQELDEESGYQPLHVYVPAQLKTMSLDKCII